MTSPCDPKCAPVGDVAAALMMVDSHLTTVYSGRTEADPEQRELADQFMTSLGPVEAADMIDGVCTLIYLYMRWLRTACEDHGDDVIARIVPNLVATMRQMPLSLRPEAIPTMAGMLVAAGTGLSPTLWRQQYGPWTEAEMTALEATALLLAEHINRITDDEEFATRMVVEALSRAEAD